MQERAERRREVADVGGDPVCWLERVCPECGLLAEQDQPTACPRCGAPWPGAGEAPDEV